jgi:NAD(P)-dependent dehydrogenase (short-subunit alcohol dehydrogenase family)
MDLHLSDKTALVTGSTAGIGLEIARKLAVEGAKVIITGRNKAKLDQAVDIIRSSGGARVSGVLADAATEEGAAALMHAAPSVDILVNNLGIYEIKDFAAITDADWRNYFEVNVLSGVRLARAYFPDMLERNWGRIIFISSESGLVTPGEMIHYGMTKTAQLAVSRGLAGLTKGTKFRAARADAFRRRHRLSEKPSQRSRGAARADRSRVLRQGPAVLPVAADDRAGRDRQSGRVCGEPSVFSHQWRCASRRRWRHAHDRLGATPPS